MSSPFSMDIAAQATAISSFEGFVDAADANNKQMLAIADSALAANRGQMSTAFQTWLEDVHTSAIHNNQVFDAIREALGFSLNATEGQEEAAAADFHAITGAVGSPFNG